MTVVEKTWDLNDMMEAEYVEIQWALQYLRNEIAYENRYWSIMRRWVDDVVYYRNYCNRIGWEGYHYASENETGNLRNFWMNDTFCDVFMRLMISCVSPRKSIRWRQMCS